MLYLETRWFLDEIGDAGAIRFVLLLMVVDNQLTAVLLDAAFRCPGPTIAEQQLQKVSVYDVSSCCYTARCTSSPCDTSAARLR